MKVYIASDHAGFKLKNFLINELQNSSRSGDGGMSGYELINSGPKKYDSSDDYPLTTQGALKNVSADPASKGILICKNGVGVTIFANRFKNIRAGLSWTPEHAESHRLDDNTNVLTLPAEFISKEIVSLKRYPYLV